MSDNLKNHVQEIAYRITDGFGDDDINEDSESMSAMDWLMDALDIRYIVGQKKEYPGAEVLVAFGGPDIWVNTLDGVVKGSWWGDSATAFFTDNIGLDDALEELYNC